MEGEGADRFIFESVAASSNATRVDQLEDFETRIDLIDLTALGASTITLSAAGASSYLSATPPAGQFNLFIRTAVTLNDVLGKNVVGTDVADNVQGTGARDTLAGRGGNDILAGGASNDIITRGSGNDIIAGEHQGLRSMR